MNGGLLYSSFFTIYHSWAFFSILTSICILGVVISRLIAVMIKKALKMTTRFGHVLFDTKNPRLSFLLYQTIPILLNDRDWLGSNVLNMSATISLHIFGG